MTALIAIFAITYRSSVGGLKKKAKSHITEIETLHDQATDIIDDLQTIRDNVKEHAEEYSAEMKATRDQFLADTGKTLARRPRYVLTQGGTPVDPSWEFDLVSLFDTGGTGPVNALLRTSGGAGFNGLTEEEKKEWQECTITFHENRSITLERPLTGKWAGNTQHFRGNPGPTQRTIKGNTAMVWEGTWSGTGAENASGAFIVYLD